MPGSTWCTSPEEVEHWCTATSSRAKGGAATCSGVVATCRSHRCRYAWSHSSCRSSCRLTCSSSDQAAYSQTCGRAMRYCWSDRPKCLSKKLGTLVSGACWCLSTVFFSRVRSASLDLLRIQPAFCSCCVVLWTWCACCTLHDISASGNKEHPRHHQVHTWHTWHHVTALKPRMLPRVAT